jgi:type I restriction enzyme S subunit
MGLYFNEDKNNIFFIYYSFLLINIEEYSNGGTLPSINNKSVYEIPIPIPHIEEQNKIGKFLKSVDDKIEITNQKLNSLKTYKTALMQQLFPQNNQTNPSLRFKNAKGDDYPDWESKRLGEVCYSKASNVIKNQLTLLSNGYPVYGADGIIGYLDKYDAVEDYISIVKDGAGCGRVLYCSKNSSILSTLQYIYTKENLFFLFIILQNINFNNYIIGSTIPHLYFKHYSNHIINIPHIEEQNKIGKFLKAVDDKIEITNQKLQHLKTYKRALMQQLFPCS